MKKFILGCGLVGLTLSGVKAQISATQLAGQLNTVTTMVPFLTITPDSRSAAMGDVGVSLFAPDANSVHWNMANLVHAEKQSGFSLSYAPWLRQLVDDVGFSYLAGYAKVGDNSVVGGSFRYFSLGNINFTDFEGNPTGNFNPNEIAIDVGYATSFNRQISMGVNLRFIYSNIAGNRAIQGIDYRAAMGGAGDISFNYNVFEDRGPQNSDLKFGFNIQNIGSKMTYSSKEKRDFIPTNLKLGVGYHTEMDDYNSFSVYMDINKLLVPTRPYYLVSWDGRSDSMVNGIRQFIGTDPNVSVPQGMIQSFYDAPGGMQEELKEYMLSIGGEYSYNDQFTARAGVFYEAQTKGGRQYGTLGFGLKFETLTVDAAYLIPFANRHPLQNQMRFSLHFDLASAKAK